MKIGIIGAGEVALAFSLYALAAGHDVVLSNSGDMEKLSRVIAPLGAGASAATAPEAAKADIVLLAVPWPKVRATLAALPAWENRILIDATNPFLQIEPTWILGTLRGGGRMQQAGGPLAGPDLLLNTDTGGV